MNFTEKNPKILISSLKYLQNQDFLGQQKLILLIPILNLHAMKLCPLNQVMRMLQCLQIRTQSKYYIYSHEMNIIIYFYLKNNKYINLFNFFRCIALIKKECCIYFVFLDLFKFCKTVFLIVCLFL